MRVDMPGIGGSMGECILCGEPFLQEILLNQTVSMIQMSQFGNHDLPIHTKKCLPVLEKNGPDWHTLPDGPLRREFEKTFGGKDANTI